MRARRVDGIVFERIEDRAVLVSGDGGELVTLNPVGTLVWEALDAASDAAAITDRLASQFPDVPREDLGDDVVAFLRELAEVGVVALDAAG